MNNLDRIKEKMSVVRKDPPGSKELAIEIDKLRDAVSSILDIIKTRNF